ncbi:glutaredoxin domain-containing protein [Jeotgalibacillus sp. JSM ZJ347]|uniref:glutaredoxin domain-containing protein n=1 Tax=Jeotgalibacillus sp. JSM ZJ347 TaxID=3342117 RepID=UPI0035A93C8B
MRFPSFIHYSHTQFFTIPGCSDCQKAISLLHNHGIPFSTIQVFENRQKALTIPYEVRKDGFPILYYKDEFYSGDDLFRLLDSFSEQKNTDGFTHIK